LEWKEQQDLELLLAILRSWSDCDAAVAVEACSRCPGGAFAAVAVAVGQ